MNSADAIIVAKQLSKRYKMYSRPSARLLEWASLGRIKRHEDFWALRNVDLSVHRGECLGVIGRNGSGKSTLLKLLTGTLMPTTGSYEVRGRLLSIIELGTGFNPELTGRQNIRTTAGLLGFDQEYVRSRFDQMLEFADIGEFIDRPIKVYSSGMHARVAFAMYAFLEPEVLVVDEVLSVGDAAFQRKCYRRMEQMIQTQQRAVVLVTHDLSAVTKFCARAIWLDGGEVQMVGPSTEVVEAYLKRTLGAVVHDELEMAEADQPPGTNVEEGLGQPVTGQQTLTAAIPATGLLPKSEAAVLYPDHGAELLGMWIENDRGQIASNVRLGDRFTICYAVRFHREQANPVFGIRIATIRGDLLVATNTEMCHAGTGKYAAGDVEIVRWAIGPGLNVGTYFISCGVSEPGEVRRFLLREVDSYQLDVTGDSQSGGMIDLNVRPTLVSATAGSPGTGRSMSMTPIESADS